LITRPARRGIRGALKGCATIGAAAAAICALAACRQDMHDQPRYEPLEASEFYADGRSARAPVEGTVARGRLQDDPAFATGRRDGVLVDALPVALTRGLVARGRERYDIFCAPCHDRVGTGEGMIVQRGYRQPPSLHVDRLLQAPDGHFFDVMTNGFGAMSDYAAQVPPADRWAIVAYVRALQLSQHAAPDDLSAEERRRLEQEPTR
jgi:hypothetical protein